jgi:hypothetical protein
MGEVTRSLYRNDLQNAVQYSVQKVFRKNGSDAEMDCRNRTDSCAVVYA